MPLMSIETALARLRSGISPINETETLSLEQALGRVLAVDQHSAIDVPPADNSAMDGYAVRSADLETANETLLPVSQRIPAGIAPPPLQPGSAARIFTGGLLPQGADSVVIQEDCIVDGDQVVLPVEVPAKITAGANVRARGQDMRQGARVLAQGERLGPAQLGILAAIGISRVPVFRKPRIAIVSTGNELVEPGVALQSGQIYNSNRATLQGLLQLMGCEVVLTLSVPDDRQATIDCLAAAAGSADMVITCGGVSVGEEDHVKPAIEHLGELDIWKLAIKPGKPMAYGHVRGVPLFGLPGNPVSVFVTFLILVRPCLMMMAGQAWPEPMPRRIAAAFSRSPNKSRQEYLRVRIAQDAAGNEQLREFTTQDSSVLTSIAWANALAVIPVGKRIDEGDLLDTLSFDQLIY